MSDIDLDFIFLATFTIESFEHKNSKTAIGFLLRREINNLLKYPDSVELMLSASKKLRS